MTPALHGKAPIPGASVPRVMVVLEHFDTLQSASRQGIELARAEGGEVLFIDVPEPGLPTRHAEALQTAGERHVRARSFSVASTDDLPDVAAQQGCHVIVVANPGGNAVSRLLWGGIVPMLITRAGVPVLVCPLRAVPPGTVAPPSPPSPLHPHA